MTTFQQQQFINDLLVESHEGLDRFDRELLVLEKGQGGAETLHSIFRIIHTLKGTSGCLGLKRIQKLAHVGESLLDLIRTGKLSVRQEIITTLLELSDRLREMLRLLESSGSDGTEEYPALIARLLALQKPPEATPPPAAFGLFEDETPVPAVETKTEELVQSIQEPGTAGPSEAFPSITQGEGPASVLSASEEAGRKTGLEAAPQAGVPATLSATDSAIRVDIHLLDKLMNLVGELVLARNQIVQNTNSACDVGLVAASQRLNIITTELQEGVMKTRMQPISSIWAKYPRIVRDVSFELGKVVRLEMEGQETELDRTIIEAIKDPLTHILRNSIDHGIETPEVRRNTGKQEEGLLHLRAYHEGGQVNIEVSDDGAGINLGKVKAKAVERGLITREQAARMGEREATNLIFLPGLSTAEKVTNVSGRGVGMDVVKTNIEKIGGSIDIQSSLGEGTTLRIKIPLTLAIIPALVITSGGERFAIPQVSLVELVRLENGGENTGLEYIFDAPVYRLRGKLLPVVSLNSVLRLTEGSHNGDGSRNLIVLKASEQLFGLVVDAVNDTQEIVVKPLGKHLKGLPVFAGATIMGDGRVALILDAFGLAQYSRVVSQGAEAQAHEAAAGKASQAVDVGSRQSLLIFTLGETRLAMPLSSVGRLEKFNEQQIEREGNREVVQYRGRIMPLLRLGELLGVHTRAGQDQELPVVVYNAEGSLLGLVVGRIEDVVEEVVDLQNQNRRRGVLGSAVIQGRVTELMDVPAIVAASGN